MKWTVSYFNEAVFNNIALWPKKLLGKYLHIINLMEQHGPNLGEPLTKSIDKKLFEIRAKSMEGIGRAFFCYVEKKEIVILHGYVKKTQKIPNKELKIAQKRLKEVLKNG